jgi:membrane protein
VLSLFPALIALISILGLVVDPKTITREITDVVSQLGPSSAVDTFKGPIEDISSNRSSALLGLIVGVALALWTASGYVGAFMRASNAIYEIEEGRPVWKTLPVRVGLTFLLLILLGVSAVGVVLTGGLAEKVGDLIGVGDTAVTVWSIAKWPVLLLVVSFMFAVLYWAAPNVKQPGFRWISPGSVLAVIGWVLASAAFAFYVANFGSYNETYGALGGVVIFPVWLWISNIMVLLGAELNAELERGRAIEAGQPEEREPFLEPRDTRKMESQRA